MFQVRTDVMREHNINVDIVSLSAFLLPPIRPDQDILIRSCHRVENHRLGQWISKTSCPKEQADRACTMIIAFRKIPNTFAQDPGGPYQPQSDARQVTNTSINYVTVPRSNFTEIDKVRFQDLWYHPQVGLENGVAQCQRGRNQPQTNARHATSTTSVIIPGSNVPAPNRAQPQGLQGSPQGEWRWVPANTLSQHQGGPHQPQSNATQVLGMSTASNIPTHNRPQFQAIPQFLQGGQANTFSQPQGGPYQPPSNSTQASWMIPPSHIAHPASILSHSGPRAPMTELTPSRALSATLSQTLQLQDKQAIGRERQSHFQFVENELRERNVAIATVNQNAASKNPSHLKQVASRNSPHLLRRPTENIGTDDHRLMTESQPYTRPRHLEFKTPSSERSRRQSGGNPFKPERNTQAAPDVKEPEVTHQHPDLEPTKLPGFQSELSIKHYPSKVAGQAISHYLESGEILIRPFRPIFSQALLSITKFSQGFTRAQFSTLCTR